MIKAVFFDIDGTIISIKKHSIPQSAIDAIARIRAAGVKTFLCTSRARQFLKNIRGVEYDGLICLTGAHSLDSEGRDIHCAVMDPADVMAAVRAVRETGQCLVGLASDRIYIEKPESRELAFALSVGGLRVADIIGGYRPFPELSGGVGAFAACGIMQLTAFFPSGDTETQFMSHMPHSHTERWTEPFVDIIGNGASKALGLEVMCRHFGFDISETAAIGDGDNDIPMIKAAGTGIAMGNASDAVRSCADFVTADVDNDGLAKALARII